jgi:hypothetical protein
MLLRSDHVTSWYGGFARNHSWLSAVAFHAPVHRDRQRVAVRLVEAADGVAVVQREHHVARVPAVEEVVRPDARHAERRQPRHLVVRDPLPLVARDGVDVRVVRAGPGGDVQERHRLVQIDADGVAPLVEQVHHLLRQPQRHLEAVAIVVVADVLAPERRAGDPVIPRLHLRTVQPVPVHHAVAPVRLRDRHDEQHRVLPDLPDPGVLRHGHAIRQLRRDLRVPGLRRMQPRKDHVDHRQLGNQRFRLRLGQRPRVGQPVIASRIRSSRARFSSLPTCTSAKRLPSSVSPRYSMRTRGETRPAPRSSRTARPHGAAVQAAPTGSPSDPWERRPGVVRQVIDERVRELRRRRPAQHHARSRRVHRLPPRRRDRHAALRPPFVSLGRRLARARRAPSLPLLSWAATPPARPRLVRTTVQSRACRRSLAIIAPGLRLFS